MKTELLKWTEENKKDLIQVCNSADRRYLSERLPYPYTEASAGLDTDFSADFLCKLPIFKA